MAGCLAVAETLLWLSAIFLMLSALDSGFLDHVKLLIESSVYQVYSFDFFTITHMSEFIDYLTKEFAQDKTILTE